MKTLLLLSTVPCLLLMASSRVFADGAPDLVRSWSVSLGPVSEGHPFYRGAVCSDGSYYFSDGLGRVVRLNSDGVIKNDVRISAMAALAIACDSDSRLVAAPLKQVLTLGPDSHGVLSVLSSVPLPREITSPFALSPVGTDRFLVLGMSSGSGHLHVIDKRGQLLGSYPSASTDSPWSPTTILNGTVTGDPSTGRVLHIPENPYVFIEFDPYQGLSRSTPRNDSGFQAPSQLSNGTRVPGDRVLKAAYLPGGDLLVQVVKRNVAFSQRSQTNVLHSSSYLELFDHSLNLKATGIPVQGLGQLQGASRDGSLYFNLISPEGGIRVTKARLTTD